MIGFGLLSLLKEDTSTGKWVGYQLVASAGSGLVVRLVPVLLLSGHVLND